MSERWRRLSPLVVLILPLIGLVELALQLYLDGRAPSFEAYAALRAPLEVLRSEHDLVVVEPAWAEPMVHRAAPIPLELAAPAEDEAHRHAVEVSLFGDRSDRLASWSIVERRQVGRFTLRRLENPSPRPSRFDFVAALSPPAVQVRFGGRACPWTTSAPVVAGGLGGHPAFPATRFACGGHPWFNVSTTVIADQDFRPRRCIWAHPPAEGVLSIVYRDVDLGEQIVGHGGMYWIIERERRGAPVALTISVEGDPIGRIVHRDGQGWAPFEVGLGRHAGRRHATVSFEVASSDYRDRHFCFEARTR